LYVAPPLLTNVPAAFYPAESNWLFALTLSMAFLALQNVEVFPVRLPQAS